MSKIYTAAELTDFDIRAFMMRVLFDLREGEKYHGHARGDLADLCSDALGTPRLADEPELTPELIHYAKIIISQVLTAEAAA